MLVLSGMSLVVHADTSKQKMKYFLMIAEPNAPTWAGAIKAGGDMAGPAGKALEGMGGKLISYWLGVGEAKNYGIVVFPDSVDIAKVTYLRASQGVMKSIQFIEVMPSSEAVHVFKDVSKMLKPVK